MSSCGGYETRGLLRVFFSFFRRPLIRYVNIRVGTGISIYLIIMYLSSVHGNYTSNKSFAGGIGPRFSNHRFFEVRRVGGNLRVVSNDTHFVVVSITFSS